MERTGGVEPHSATLGRRATQPVCLPAKSAGRPPTRGDGGGRLICDPTKETATASECPCASMKTALGQMWLRRWRKSPVIAGSQGLLSGHSAVCGASRVSWSGRATRQQSPVTLLRRTCLTVRLLRRAEGLRRNRLRLRAAHLHLVYALAPAADARPRRTDTIAPGFDIGAILIRRLLAYGDLVSGNRFRFDDSLNISDRRRHCDRPGAGAHKPRREK